MFMKLIEFQFVNQERGIIVAIAEEETEQIDGLMSGMQFNELMLN